MTKSKHCAACDQTKPVTEYYKHKNRADGVGVYCKTCSSLKRKEHYRRNAERTLDQNKQWKRANKERYHKWCAEYIKRRYKEDEQFRARTIATVSARYTRTRYCLSESVKQDVISIYLNCPIGYHVDHIIPLNGELVSGLHCPANLQYLPASENLSKGNKFDWKKYNGFE